MGHHHRYHALARKKWPVVPNKELVHKTSDGRKIMKVPGWWIRDNLDVGWIGAGNPERDPYVPPDEIWVEDVFFLREENKHDVEAFPVHEMKEAKLMRKLLEESGVDEKEIDGVLEEIYDIAHHEAEGDESEFRQRRYGVKAPLVRD